MVTVAVRRIDFDASGEDITDFLPDDVLLLPNTSGAETADDAVRIARLARAGGLPDWIKLEVIPDPRYLLPDPIETLRAAEILVADGFTVMPYVMPDPVLARRLEEAGCATVMPLAAPIGSGRGLKLLDAIRITIEETSVPVVVDAGLGSPSHAAAAMKLGAAGRARQHGDRAFARPGRDGGRLPACGERRPVRVPRGHHGRAARGGAVEPGRRSRHRDVSCTVNGRPHEPEPDETVARLLERLGLESRYALVERNREPVAREVYESTPVEDGDVFVVARPVAGG